MISLAEGHEKSTLALITLIPLFFFYSLLFDWILFFLPIVLFLLIFHLYFFRDPFREGVSNNNHIIAPADGTVFEVLHSEGIIRIRMSLFNVHVNRWPVSGEIISISEIKGSHWPFLSFIRRGTDENSRKIIKLKNEIGEFTIIQIVGILARRCVVYSTTGEQVKQGERLGMIQYGSEVDIHFPVEKYEIIIEKNAPTKAGVTILAKIKAE
jgi:phosphatidylserine decarboxylase